LAVVVFANVFNAGYALTHAVCCFHHITHVYALDYRLEAKFDELFSQWIKSESRPSNPDIPAQQ
jgi:hypothetical protein